MLKVLMVGASLAVAGFAGLSLFGQTATKNFQVNVSIEVDGKTLAGSRVWQMTTTSLFNPFGNASPYRTSSHGEAIPIQIAEDLVAFAILRSQGSNRADAEYGDLLLECGVVSPSDISNFSGGCEVQDKPAILLAVGDAATGKAPSLVFLEDYSHDDRRISVLSVSVNVTTEAVSTGILSAFPWINDLPSPYKVGKSTGNNIPYIDTGVIYQIDFVREAAK